eukprot:gene2272-2584_t
MQPGALQRPWTRRCAYLVHADATARVRGDARRVQRWVSDVRHWQQFYPGTKKAVKIGNGYDPIKVGAKFEVERDLLGMKLPMRQMDQFFFMADRHDANFCAVRYITDIRLREWRAYLQPLATRYAASVPEEAMSNLQKTLNSAHSPVYRNRRAHAAAAATSSGASSAEVVVLDPMGYYRLLGLSPRVEVDEEEIKAAYRKLALQLHPDRHIGKDAAAQAEAAEQFALLLKAYDTLKDPEQRRLYNAGQYMEATLKL